ncbi:hypothetical protein PAGU2638_19980 [Lysobacter sp. PAGU 2638]
MVVVLSVTARMTGAIGATNSSNRSPFTAIAPLMDAMRVGSSWTRGAGIVCMAGSSVVGADTNEPADAMGLRPVEIFFDVAKPGACGRFPTAT